MWVVLLAVFGFERSLTARIIENGFRAFVPICDKSILEDALSYDDGVVFFPGFVFVEKKIISNQFLTHEFSFIDYYKSLNEIVVLTDKELSSFFAWKRIKIFGNINF